MRGTIPWYASAAPGIVRKMPDGQAQRHRLAKTCSLNAAVTFLIEGDFGAVEDLIVELDNGSAEWRGHEIEALYLDKTRPYPLDRANPL